MQARRLEAAEQRAKRFAQGILCDVTTVSAAYSFILTFVLYI
jgi:hypothetical protein